jgi:hypothetical protein
MSMDTKWMLRLKFSNNIIVTLLIILKYLLKIRLLAIIKDYNNFLFNKVW